MTDKTDSKEREAFIAFLMTFPRSYTREIAEHYWDNEHVSALAWRAGRASLAASAGSEPVAFGHWFTDDPKAFATPGSGFLVGKEPPKNAINVIPLYTHPSPPEGMVGGWISVDERLPPPFEEVVVYPRPDDYCCEAFCDTAGNWRWAEYEHDFGVHHRECQVEYWLMLPEVPAPLTTSAGSGKGE